MPYRSGQFAFSEGRLFLQGGSPALNGGDKCGTGRIVRERILSQCIGQFHLRLPNSGTASDSMSTYRACQLSGVLSYPQAKSVRWRSNPRYQAPRGQIRSAIDL
jgi:hypothetical protein